MFYKYYNTTATESSNSFHRKVHKVPLKAFIQFRIVYVGAYSSFVVVVVVIVIVVVAVVVVVAVAVVMVAAASEEIVGCSDSNGSGSGGILDLNPANKNIAK